MSIFDKLATVRSLGTCFHCNKENRILRMEWFTNENDINNLNIKINTCLDCYEKIDKEMNNISESDEVDWWMT